jgi:hypothetical protein
MLAVAAGKDGDSRRRGSFVRSVVLGSYDVFLEKPSVSNGDVKAGRMLRVAFGSRYVQRRTGSAVASLP